MMASNGELELTDYIRSIPDYPKPGILFRDITPLLAAPAAFRRAIAMLADYYRGKSVDYIAAAEARGFMFAAPLALELDVGLIPIRKPGKLPCKTVSHSYALEYGTDTLHLHCDDLPAGANVVVIDDLLATGGTVEACCRLVEKVGSQVVGCAFVVELVDLGGRTRIAQYDTLSLVQYEGA